MIVTLYWLVFVVAFMGCVLATPFVTRIASWAGAIDRPDQFRRIHAGAVPRMGGLGMAAGVLAAVLMALRREDVQSWLEFAKWSGQLITVLAASLLVLAVGIVDDSRGMGPRAKLAGQALAVLILYMGGIRIDKLTLLGLTMDFTPFNWEVSLGAARFAVGIPGLAVTMLWFLGCMNVWNLIDGMDGLASGVGFLVSFTLMLVAIHLENTGAAVLAAALAGSLFGFLLYNWHPACIFLGDSGSLLIGLLIGVIGVQGSMKGSATVSILFPLLAMGLPISDTAMAIFRRWVRNLPLSLADRRHVHHLLMGLGLNPRQASFLLYIFSGFLCGVVLLGVTFNNEFLALGLGASGVIAFLLILTSRRDELDHLRADFFARMTRGRQERAAARVTFETIQRIELCKDDQNVWALMVESADKFGYGRLSLVCQAGSRVIFEADSLNDPSKSESNNAGPAPQPQPAAKEQMTAMTGPNLVFRLSLRRDFAVMVRAYHKESPGLASDIAYRFLQRLAEAGSSRLAELRGFDWGCEAGPDPESDPGSHPRPRDAASPPQAQPQGVLGGREAGSPNSPLNLGAVVAASATAPSDTDEVENSGSTAPSPGPEPSSGSRLDADAIAIADCPILRDQDIAASSLPSSHLRPRVWEDVWGSAWGLAARSLRLKLRLRQASSRAVHDLK